MKKFILRGAIAIVGLVLFVILLFAASSLIKGTFHKFAENQMSGVLSELSARKSEDEKSSATQSSQPEQEEISDSSPDPSEHGEASFWVEYIDIGQADATLICCEGHYMLIDGGYHSTSDVLYTVLKNHGITHLDYLICTHAHADHCGGLSAAYELATVSHVLAPVTEDDRDVSFTIFCDRTKKAGYTIEVPKHGEVFFLGTSQCEVLGPISTEQENVNNTSIVLRVTYGETAFLFCGDAELEEETEILDEGYDIRCDVLKCGHHGSSTSTNYRWLYYAEPTYAVISCGKNNDYGHPHEQTLSRLRDAEVEVYRTDELGDIYFYSDGNTVWTE